MITLDDIEHFAHFTGDTFYAHMDDEAAKASPIFEGRVAHGYLVLSMAAGATGLREVFTPEVAETLNHKGDNLRDRMKAAAERQGVPVQVMGVGSILSIHYQDTPIQRPEDAETTLDSARILTHLALIERGFITARRGFMSLSLVLEEAHYDAFADAFEDVLSEWRDVLT